MRCWHKRKEGQPLVGAAMFVLNLVFLALLAASTSQLDIPRYVQGQWIITDDDLQYEDTDGQSLAVEESIWPDSPSEVVEQVTAEDLNLLTTPEPYNVKDQASDDDEDDDEEEESTVWKIVLVAAIVLVSIVGSLSMAYYLCVWRGGRIHYRPQKEGYA